MSNALPDDGVTATKHVRSCFNVNFNVNFKFFWRQFLCASVGEKTLIISRSAVCMWEIHFRVCVSCACRKHYVCCISTGTNWYDWYWDREYQQELCTKPCCFWGKIYFCLHEFHIRTMLILMLILFFGWWHHVEVGSLREILELFLSSPSMNSNYPMTI
jgi:hypothetical protein